jgi:hypothetical protein
MASQRLQKLESRRIDPFERAAGLHEVYKRLSEDDAVKYAVGAMQPIDPTYTANTYEQGNRIRDQLKEAYASTGISSSFDYQGSVTNDTHIRAHSDIDLLSIHERFFTLEPPLVPAHPYLGDPIADLMEMRRVAASRLRSSFPQATVDESGGKCITVRGGSLRRDIDVVVCNRWDTVEYSRTSNAIYRGLNVLDATVPKRVDNKPFLHNYRLDLKDRETSGGLRKSVRLLKSLKYDAESAVDMTSYDIASLVYSADSSYLNVPKGSELLLVERTGALLRYLIENPAVRSQILVPNEMRSVFGTPGATESGLRQLHREIAALLRDIEQGLSRSFKKLADARVSY